MDRWLAVLMGGVFLLGLAPIDEVAADSFAKLRFDDVTPPAGDAGTIMRFGGEVRQRYERTDDPAFGAEAVDDDAAWLQRYSVFGDLSAGRMRAFLQVQSALEQGRVGGASPVDEDKLSWQNAFLEFRVPGAGLRAGRQELSLGSGRLVDVREGPNVRRTFDAVRAIVEVDGWHIDALASWPLRPEPGSFDNDPDRDQDLWGIYATAARRDGNLDVYYLGYHHRRAAYVQGAGTEVRHSIGARWWGQHQAWDWNWEAVFQAGRFGDGDIRAWTLATETGRTWRDSRWQPRVALSANAASGDRNPRDDDLETFNPLFPRGNYFSEAAILGPRNFFNVHPFVSIQRAERWTLTAHANWFWRLETGDGVYAPNGAIIRDGLDTSARFVGGALSLSAELAVNSALTLTIIYAHFEPGAFLQDTGPSLDLDFVETTLQFRF